MLGAMPTGQLITMLKMAPPHHAAGVLMAMPTDRVIVLLTSMDPTDLARILAATEPARKAALLALLDVESIAPMLLAMSRKEAIALVAALPPERVLAVLETVPAYWASVLLTAMSSASRMQVLAAMRPQRAAELRAMIYQVHVAQALSRTAATVTRIADHQSCDFLVKTCGHSVALAIRYHDRGLLTLHEVLAAQVVTYEIRIDGVLIVTNARPSDDVIRYEGETRDCSRPVEAVIWRGDGDDGILRRAVARLVH